MDFLNASWMVMLELAPWLLLGVVVASLLHLLLPEGFASKYLAGRRGVISAVALGVPLPLCSCGVIPAGIGLKRQGASDGAAMGFLISTPQTGVDSILVGASMLGWPFAIAKVIAALTTGLIGGWIVDRMPASESVEGAKIEASSGEPRTVEGAIAHGVDVLRSIWGWLAVGVLVSAAITVWVPTDTFTGLSAAGGLLAALAALLISLPMYVCATASVPIAAALVAAGMPIGAALVFLMAGPATNVATVGAIYRAFGGRKLAAYLGVIITGSMVFAVGFEHLLAGSAIAPGHLHEHGGTWWELALALVLTGAMAWFAVQDARAFLSRRRAARIAKAYAAESVAISIEGMTCRGCAGKVERAVGGLEGVDAAIVDLDPGQVTVTGRAAESAIRAAITGAGFKPV